jgi:hypothetical protein
MLETITELIDDIMAVVLTYPADPRFESIAVVAPVAVPVGTRETV